jgi:tetratricopeptide (TPR) repeat protein
MVARAEDTADAVSNAVVSPEGSLFLREILEKALSNPVGVAPRWLADSWALLANVLMNDYLNGWNHAANEELRNAEDAVQNALALNKDLALAVHAKGLVYRAKGEQKAALEAFERAVTIDPGFARAHAQVGNQKVLLGREQEAQAHLDEAIRLAPRHPALGYFHWAKGRAYFHDQKWPEAAEALHQAVEALPTVWYNRCHQVSALHHAGKPDEAKSVLQEFLDHPQFGHQTFARVASPQGANPNDHPKVAAARDKLCEGLQAVRATL